MKEKSPRLLFLPAISPPLVPEGQEWAGGGRMCSSVGFVSTQRFLCPQTRASCDFAAGSFDLEHGSEQSLAVQRQLGCSRQLAPLLPYLCWTQLNLGTPS